MRSLLVMSAAVALLGADAAGAQRVVARGPGVSYPAPTITAPRINPPTINGTAPVIHRPLPMRAPMAPRGMSQQIGGHGMHGRGWGNKINGRWYAGVQAPGGWNSYRRPVRGWALPTYWLSPSFGISDWSGYGLPQPPYGYSWSRYYDDAVLIDGRGSVYDSVADVDWDSRDDGSYVDDRGYDDRGYDDRGYDEGVYTQDDRYAPRGDGYARRDNGVGGAVTGAVVGGVAGNLIGGRGNRLGGTLIGAGVGAAAGYAIDKHEDDRRGPPPPPPPARGYGAGYPPPRAYAPQVRVYGGSGNTWVSPDGGTRVVTTSGGYGGSTTVVTVQSAPVVTTTTTDIYEDRVTYSRPKARPKSKVHSKRVWRSAPRCSCR